MSITTKTGDKGLTRLLSGEEVSKNHPRTRAYGTIDELVSILGIARSFSDNSRSNEEIKGLQRQLFVVGAELATSPEQLPILSQRVDEAMLSELETQRDELEARVPMPSGFVLAGGTPVAAHLDHARCVARRCEREAVGLQEAGLIDNPQLIVWLNRLSDYLWLLARQEEGARVVLKDA